MAEAAARDAVWLDVLPSMKGFGSELAKGAEKEADKTGKSTGRKFGTAMLAGVAVVAGGATLAAKALYGIGETFDEVSDTIRVGTGATGDALAALEESAKRIGTRVPAEFEAIGTMVADVNTRLGLTGPTLEKFASQALEAGRIMGEEIDINAVSAALNAFQVQGEDTTDAMDHLYRVSQATGVGMNELATNAATSAPALQALGFTFEETTALVGNLDKAGMNSSKMMAGMSRALVELAKDGEEPQEAFKRVTGEIQGFLDEGNKAAAVDLASKLFGTRNATQFIGALESGALAMDDLGSVAGMTEDTILGAGKETMDFAEQWQIFKNQVLVALEPIAARVFNTFGKGMEWVNSKGIPYVKALWESFKSGEGSMAGVRDVADQVWAVFKGVGQWMVDNKAVVATFVGVLAGLLIINKVVTAVKALNLVLRANPIGIVITLIAALAAALVWLYNNNETARRIMDKAWAAIKSAIKAVVDWFRNTAWPWMRDVFQSLGDKVKWLWQNIYKPYFTFILDKVKAVAGWIKDTAWPWMRDAFSKMATKAGAVKDSIVGAWDKMRSGISSGWDKIKGVFDRFKKGLSSLRDRFTSVKDGIGRTWSALTGLIARPINGVIDLANKFLNRLQRGLNKIPGVSLPGTWGSIANVSWSSGGGGGGGRAVQALAGGGMVRGPWRGARADNVLGVDDHGVPTARVNPREMVLSVAGTARLLRQVGMSGLNMLNRGILPGFGGGGLVGRTGGALDKAWDWVSGLWSAGKKWVGDLLSSVMPDWGSSWPARAVKGIVGGLDLGSIAGAVKELALKVLGGDGRVVGGQHVNYGGLYGWAPSGPGWRMMSAMAKAIAPEATITSAYRPGAITASGIPSLHGLGRAVDLWAPNLMSLFMKLRAAVGSSASQLYYTPAGGAQIGYRDAAVAAMHHDHVHWGYNRGGLVRKPLLFDAGGYMPPTGPGEFVPVQNRTGKPEPLGRLDKPLTLAQADLDYLADRINDGALEAALRGAEKQSRLERARI